MSLLDSNVSALISLVSSRPSLAAQMVGTLAGRRTGAAEPLSDRRTFAAYVDVEKELGRVVPDGDTEPLALVATVHQPRLADREGGPDPRSLMNVRSREEKRTTVIAQELGCFRSGWPLIPGSIRSSFPRECAG